MQQPIKGVLVRIRSKHHSLCVCEFCMLTTKYKQDIKESLYSIDSYFILRELLTGVAYGSKLVLFAWFLIDNHIKTQD